MPPDEFEDYLELRDPDVQKQIEESNLDIRAGRTRPAADLLADLQEQNRRSHEPTP